VQHDLRGATVTVEQTITLRDVGRRLARLRRSRDKVASDELLDLLKSGEITAGFRFPGRTIFWIKVPAHYWSEIRSDEFRVIRYSRKKKNSGVFPVSLGDFAEDIVTQVNEQLKNNKSDASNEWKAVLEATIRTYEVEIKEAEWEDYKNRNNLTEPSTEIKSKSGRHQLPSWRDLSVIIGAYLIKHYSKTKNPIKIEWAKEKIHAIAKAENDKVLPSADTIKEVLSKILSRAETISID
jgi:hypothetical protein